MTVTRGVRLQQGEEDGKSVDDPHVWHDPANAKAMVDNIAAALARADPGRTDDYEANATAYKKRLDETRTRVQAIINEIPADGRKLVTNHDALDTSRGPSASRSSAPSSPASRPRPSRPPRRRRSCSGPSGGRR